MRPRNVLIVPNDPLEIYAEYGQLHSTYPFSYFDPQGWFQNVRFAWISSLQDRSWRRGKFCFLRIHRPHVFPLPILNWMNPIPYVRFIRRVTTQARDASIGIVRAYNPHVEGLLACIVAKRIGAPLVVSVHTNHKESRGFLMRTGPSAFVQGLIELILEPLVYRHATEIWVVSSHLQFVLEKQGVPREKIRIRHNRVDLNTFGMHDKSLLARLRRSLHLENSFVFMHVGRYVPEKNHQRLVRAFAKVHEEHPDTKLLLFSKGPLQNKIREEVKRLNLSDSVKFMGVVPNATLAQYLQMADAFVFPSLFEGFGIVLIEAQASGCPVLTSDIASVRDIVTEKNAFFMNPASVQDIATCMQRVIEYPLERKAKVIEAKRNVKKFSWKSQDVLDISTYKKLLLRL